MTQLDKFSFQIGVSRYSLTSSAREFCKSPFECTHINVFTSILKDRKELSTSGRMVNLRDLFLGDDHLKGEHTVRMSPIRYVPTLNNVLADPKSISFPLKYREIES